MLENAVGEVRSTVACLSWWSACSGKLVLRSGLFAPLVAECLVDTH
jgi:hypothetical protein